MDEVPFEDRHVPRVEVDWDRSAWWWYPLTRVIHPAVRMTALAVSLIALWIAVGGIVLGDWLFHPRWDAELVTFFGQHFQQMSDAGSLTPAIVVWIQFFFQAVSSIGPLGWNELAFVTFEFLWLCTTFALFGGVLARRAAFELGQRTISPWGEAIGLVASRWQSYLWASGMHFVGIFVLLLPALLLGLCSRLGTVGSVVAGVLLLLCYPLVFGIGRFALSAIICFPLSVVAICVEKKADAFEGFSRSNAYFFQRPVVAALCSLLLLAAGLVGEKIVYWTLHLGWWLMRHGFAFSGGPGAQDNLYLNYGDWLTQMLIAAYWFSFFWAAVAAIYLILRRSVDNCELDEMDCLESEVERTLPDIPTTSQAAPASAENSGNVGSAESSDAENSASDSSGPAPEAS